MKIWLKRIKNAISSYNPTTSMTPNIDTCIYESFYHKCLNMNTAYRFHDGDDVFASPTNHLDRNMFEWNRISEDAPQI